MQILSGARPCSLCGNTKAREYCNVQRSYGGQIFELQLGQCTHCGFIFLSDPPLIPYDAEYLSIELPQDKLALFRAQERIAAIEHYVPGISRASFLDIGIGDGLLLSVAEKAEYRTFGLDVNPESIFQARKKYRIQSEITIAEYPQTFEGRTFDVIHLNEVIEHIDNPLQLLRWCYTHLSEHGCLVIQTGNIESFAARYKGRAWDYIRPVHINYFANRTLSEAVQRAGLRILSRSSVDWRWHSSVQMAISLLTSEGPSAALRFFWMYITALPVGIRRTIILYAGRR
jgi:2-polyprenyl-3-methyl-5-hydroxy-6-metoxy-1,4-benzoquinol methylase